LTIEQEFPISRGVAQRSVEPTWWGRSRSRAEAGYRNLAGSEFRQHIIDGMQAKEYDVTAMMNEYLALP